MRSVRGLLVFATLAVGAATACSSDSTTDPFAPQGLALTLSPAADTVFVSDSLVLTAGVSLSLSATSFGNPVQTPSGVEWSSSNPDVAVVDETGKVTPIGFGTTT